MMPQEFQAEERAPEISRRNFLRHGVGAAAGASLAPGILLISACARREVAAPGTAAGQPRVVDYELSVGRRDADPDGRGREVFCYNDQLPGPLVRAKVGDTLRIKVANQLAVPTSIHWHGMHQPGTWQMDGVANVSRPPIAPGSSFVYEFKATPAGTHWYHSHVGVQYGDGLFGPLVIDEEKPMAQYDREEVLLINDWFLEPSEEILAALLKPSEPGTSKMAMDKAGATGKTTASAKDKAAADKPPANKAMPEMKRMKGMPGTSGKADVGDVPFESALFNGKGRFGDTQAPLTTIDVKPGETLRLRLINGSSTYAFRFQIDGHPLTVIATDGSPIAPMQVDNLTFSPGERYDVLLKADQSGVAWVRAATANGDEAKAVLRYAGAPESEPAVSEVVWGKQPLVPEQMRSLAPVELGPRPREIALRLGGTMSPYAWSINDQEYPQADPIAVAQDEWIHFVMNNPTGMDHPFHLHGNYFYVLGKPDDLNLLHPPRKDTVNVPAKSQLVIAWQANNPGHWFFHCHIEWHVATGMARVIEVAPR